MTSNPRLFWGLIVSMWFGNLNPGRAEPPPGRDLGQAPEGAVPVPLSGDPGLLRIGAYTVNNDTFSVIATAAFGLLGYIFMKPGCEPAPLLLGFVLGPMMEENFRRSLLLSRGEFSVFFTCPLSLALLVISAALIVTVTLPSIKSKREEIGKG